MKKKQPKKDDDRMKKLYIRNWILAIVSLGLAILAYNFFK